MVKLSQTSNLFPKALLLSDVQCNDRDPWSSDGFGDVFRGLKDGKIVALKCVRVYQNEDPEIKKESVNFYVLRFAILTYTIEVLSRSHHLGISET